MVKEIEVATIDELQQLVDNIDFKVAEPIVKAILRNLETTKKNIHVLSVLIRETEAIYDITLKRELFKEELEKYLPAFEKKELYEECSTILNTIKKLQTEINVKGKTKGNSTRKTK